MNTIHLTDIHVHGFGQSTPPWASVWSHLNCLRIGVMIAVFSWDYFGYPKVNTNIIPLLVALNWIFTYTISNIQSNIAELYSRSHVWITLIIFFKRMLGLMNNWDKEFTLKKSAHYFQYVSAYLWRLGSYNNYCCNKLSTKIKSLYKLV